MAKPKDLTHATFNFIKVVGPAGTNSYGNRLWRCRCLVCRRDDIVRTTSNVQRSYSCGCRTARGRTPQGNPTATLTTNGDLQGEGEIER